MACNAFNQPSRGGELYLCPFFPDFRDVGMGKSMIAYFVPASVYAFQQGDIVFCSQAHDEKSGRHIFFFKDIKNPWSIALIGAVIKSQYHLVHPEPEFF